MEKYKIEYKFINLFFRDIGYFSCTVLGYIYIYIYFDPPLYLFLFFYIF